MFEWHASGILGWIKHAGSENHSRLHLLRCAWQAAVWLSMPAVVETAGGEDYLRELFQLPLWFAEVQLH